MSDRRATTSPGGPPRDRRAAARAVGLPPDGAGEALFRVQAACDQRCLFCSADPHRETVVRDPAALAAAVRGLSDAAGAPVVLSGGEPTLGARLPDQVDAVLAAGGRAVMIQTNGMRLSEPNLLDGLAPHRERVLFLVSLHSHRADVSDVLTRTRGGYERTLAGIDAALAMGFPVWVNHVLNALNVAEAEPFVRFLRERFPALSLLVVSFVNPTFRAAANPWLMPPLDAVGPPLRRALAAAEAIGLAVAVSEVCGVPLCVVRGHEAAHDAFVVADRPPTGSRRPAATAALPRPPLPPDRVKGPPCAACRWDARCLGVWEGYAARHGFAGLEPAPPEEDAP